MRCAAAVPGIWLRLPKNLRFAARQARIEAHVAAGVVAELPPHRARLANRIMSSNLCAAFGRKNQRGENAQQCGLARAVRAEQGKSLARTNTEGNPGKGKDRGLFERLQQRVPPAARGRKRFLDGFNADRSFGHGETYSVSFAPGQWVSGGRYRN